MFPLHTIFPSLVPNRDLGMEESLFARLDNTGGTYELDLQYRMNRLDKWPWPRHDLIILSLR